MAPNTLYRATGAAIGELIMYKSIFSFVIAAPLLSACGATFPPPTQRMADAQSAERSARQVGAEQRACGEAVSDARARADLASAKRP